MSTWKSAGKVRMTPMGVWDSTIPYEVLDCVNSADGLTYYIAKQDVPAGTLLTNTDYWYKMIDTSSSFANIKSVIANTFSPNTNYSIGYIVWKDGNLYEFKTTHTGEWNDDDVTPIKINNKIYKSLQIRGTNVADAGTLLSSIYYRQPGIYKWNSQYLPGDLPKNETGPGMIINFGDTNSNSVFTQMLVMNSSANMYYRQLYATDTWTKWKRIITTEDTVLYGYQRNYTDISGLLTWERKTIGSISGIADSTTRVIAKLPNVGNIEVKLNTPNSKFVIVLEDNSGSTPVYTYLTNPTWSTYFYRYTGDPNYNYYVMTQMQTGSEIGEEYGPLNVKVYTYDDIGKAYNVDNVWYGKRIAIIGDSIVQGRFRKNGASSTNSIATKPAAVLLSEMCNTEPGEYGIGGATVYGTDWKSLQTNATNVKNYDVVLIFAGTNDFGSGVSIEDFSAAYGEVVDTLVANNNTTVVAVTPTARSNNNNNSIGLKLKDYVDAIKAVAESKSIDVIDINALTFNNNAWINNLSDGIHPNEIGQKMIADMILQNIP